jgi:hypothetical protein
MGDTLLVSLQRKPQQQQKLLLQKQQQLSLQRQA